MSNWALRNSQAHPSHRCACARCTEQYNMHYSFDWMGAPRDVPAGTPTGQGKPPEYDLQRWPRSGTVKRNTSQW